jgi:hypothetical protein
MVQKEFGVRPVYDVRRSSGPDHSRLFRMEVVVRGRKWGEGIGKSKKEAEQAAAEDALEAWEKDPDKLRVRGRGSRDSGSRGRDRAEAPSRGGRDRGERSSRGGRDRSEAPTRGGRNVSHRDRDEGDDRENRRDERPEKERAPREARGRGRGAGGGGRSERSSSRSGGSSRRSPRGRELDKDVFVPPPEIDDPIAWAAGESYRPRSASPKSAIRGAGGRAGASVLGGDRKSQNAEGRAGASVLGGDRKSQNAEGRAGASVRGGDRMSQHAEETAWPPAAASPKNTVLDVSGRAESSLSGGDRMSQNADAAPPVVRRRRRRR